jgi:cellulose synthase/poly-beta-1,6-N-acetylglucosamine synthase-like glycosyltransferase
MADSRQPYAAAESLWEPRPSARIGLSPALPRSESRPTLVPPQSRRKVAPYQPRHSRQRRPQLVVAPAPGRARRGGHRALGLTAGLAAAAVVLTACWFFPYQAVLVLLTAAAVFNMTVGSLETRWRLHAWRHPEAAAESAWPAPVTVAESLMTFSLILAAKDEASVIGDTLRGLMKQTHPRYEVIVSLCAEDTATITAAREVAAAYPRSISVVTAHYDQPSKAQQLNTALELCRGDVVGVIDAEDDVADALLVHVEALLRRSGADVVQGGVQLMNLGSRPAQWFQVHNVLEYFFWYTARMSFHAQAGFVPLGGNTVFVYRELLLAADGWPVSLTEDCALGVLLAARFNVQVATAYSAELCTREESPQTLFNKELGSLFWQRDRWVRGFLAELMRGTWRGLPTLRQRIFAAYLLATPLLQGVSSLMLPLAILTALTTKAPIALALLLFLPLVPMGITLLTQLVGLRQFSSQFGTRASAWHFASLIFLLPVYQLVLMAAAATAAVKYASGDTRWYKTGRASQHRGLALAAAPERAL